MEEKIFLSTLLYKSIVEKSTGVRHLSYKVLGPMLGTITENVFINTHDRKYTSIEKTNTNMCDNIRYAYYNLISLKEAKEKYNVDTIEKVIEKYKSEYEKDSYYVIDVDLEEPIIIRYDKNKLKRVFDSNIAKPI